MICCLSAACIADEFKRVAPAVFEVPRGAQFEFGGFVGERIKANVRNWLLIAPASNPAMLQMFRDRDRAPHRDLVPWAGEFAGRPQLLFGQRSARSGDAR